MSLTHLIKVTSRTFAVEFYRMNSGFFLVVATLLFGFMSKIEHVALAQFFVSSPATIAIPLTLSIIYGLWVLRFNRAQFSRDENLFIHHLAFLKRTEKVVTTLSFLTLQFFPAIVYAVFLAATAAQLSRPDSMLLIIVVIPACCMALAAIMVGHLNSPRRESNASFLERVMDRLYIRPHVQYYIEWVLRHVPLLLVGTKLLSGAVVFGACSLYIKETYDQRLLAMAITLCGTANMTIIYHVVDCEHRQMAWIRNMPVSLTRRFLVFFTAIAILSIPEIVVLIRHFPAALSFRSSVDLTLYLFAINAFFIGYLHTRSLQLDRFTRKGFWTFVALILLILLQTPVAILSVGCASAGFILFTRSYYRTDYTQSTID